MPTIVELHMLVHVKELPVGTFAFICSRILNFLVSNADVICIFITDVEDKTVLSWSV